MGIVEKIKEIENEMAKTQKNKATNGHLGLLKARLAKLRSELLDTPGGGGGGAGSGFAVQRFFTKITYIINLYFLCFNLSLLTL